MTTEQQTLPDDFTSYTSKLMGEELYDTFIKALEEEPPVSIRLNKLKTGEGQEQATDGYDGKVAWCHEGVYLSTRPNFTADPLLHAGCYYVQEASSMFVTHVLRQLVKEPVSMLDLCAAPGGKSTAARSVLPEGSLLFANEPMRNRANILSENIQKFGHPDVIVTNNFPRDYKRSKLMFDVVLADVPCSGEGMFRKDSGAVDDWSRTKVDECASLQRDIISDIWNCLKPGGILIYSTCTFNAYEDEDNVMWIANNLGADFIKIDTQPEWAITPALTQGQKGETSGNGPLTSGNGETDASGNEPSKEQLPCYRFIPGRTRGEGLFMAVLRKHGEWKDNAKETKDSKKGKDRKKKGNNNKDSKAALPATLPLFHADRYALLQHGESVFAINREWESTATVAMASLNVMNMGVTIGTMRGKALLPDQSLALSTVLDRNAYPVVDVSLTEAISYLRRDTITLPPNTPTGFVLITFRDHPLGFVKNIGNRCNNLYPAEWRIKSTHLEEQYEVILKEL